MKKKPEEIFISSNGVKIEYAPDSAAARPFTEAELEDIERISSRDILSRREMQALAEFAGTKTRGRPRKARPKVNATFRIDADLLDAIRATGKGWQTRINAALRAWMAQHS